MVDTVDNSASASSVRETESCVAAAISQLRATADEHSSSSLHSSSQSSSSLASPNAFPTEDTRLNSMLNNLLDDMKKRDIFGVKTAETFWPRQGERLVM